MSRTLTSHLTDLLAARLHTRARCLRLRLTDGTIINITDHDAVLTADIGLGDEDYSPATGIMPGDLALSVGLDADNFEVRGPLSATVTRASVLGGRFDRAVAWLFDVDWLQADPDILALLKGRVSEAKIEGGQFVLEVRSETDRYNQTIGDLIVNYCRADFGDTRCGFPVRPDAWAALTAVTARGDWDAKVGDTVRPSTFNGYHYECTTAGTTGASEPTWSTTLGGTTSDGSAVWTTRAATCFEGTIASFVNGFLFSCDAFPVATTDNQFNLGTIEFTSGPLDGLPPIEIFDYAQSTRTFSLFTPFPEPPEVGNTLLIRMGCSKLRTACVAYRNTWNLRSFPEVPGTDQVLKYPVPQ